MQIGRILYPVKVLGPGNRIGIWVQGCKRACPGCANPELWKQEEKKNISMNDFQTMLRSILEKYPVDGVTISGGEPFLQTKELAELVNFLRNYTTDILIFTGYERKALLARKKEAEQTTYVLEHIAVLVDGKYVEERNDGHPLRGSSNQRIYYRDEKVKNQYEQYIREQKTGSKVQMFPTSDGTVLVGIHQKDFKKQLEKTIREHGVATGGSRNGG